MAAPCSRVATSSILKYMTFRTRNLVQNELNSVLNLINLRMEGVLCKDYSYVVWRQLYIYKERVVVCFYIIEGVLLPQKIVVHVSIDLYGNGVWLVK